MGRTADCALLQPLLSCRRHPIAALYDIPVKKGAEAQLAKAAEAEARGKKRTAAQLPSNWSCPACATAAATPAT